MSSIRLLKDHGKAKKGDVVSVPFGEGKRLLRDGIGIYADAVQPAEPEPAKPVRRAAPSPEPLPAQVPAIPPAPAPPPSQPASEPNAEAPEEPEHPQTQRETKKKK